MSESRIILPLESAIREACAEMSLPFPERNSGRTILYGNNDIMASYSTEFFPVTDRQTPEVLRLARAVETFENEENNVCTLEIYVALTYYNKQPNIVITYKDGAEGKRLTPKGTIEASQMASVFELCQENLLRYHRINGDQVTPDVLKQAAKDYLVLLGHAKEVIKPVDPTENAQMN